MILESGFIKLSNDLIENDVCNELKFHIKEQISSLKVSLMETKHDKVLEILLDHYEELLQEFQ